MGLEVDQFPIFWEIAIWFSSWLYRWSVPLIPHLYQHELALEFLIIAILTGIRCNLRVIWFAFPWCLRMLNISLSVSQPFDILLSRIIWVDLWSIFKLNFLYLVSWVGYIFWILVLYQTWSWWKSFPTLYVSTLSSRWCPLSYRSFSVS